MTALFVVTTLAALLFSCLARVLGRRLWIVDLPNARSSHDAPTPRTGGIAVAGGWFLALAAAGHFLPGFDPAVLVLAAATILFGLGFLDDLLSLTPRTRLAVQVVTAMTLVVGLAAGQKALGLPWQVLTVPLAVGAFVWFVNLFNFMDGINAIAALQYLFMLGGAVLIHPALAQDATALAAVLLGAAVLGFLPFNLIGGRLFLGDGGSYLLGGMLAAIALHTVYLSMMTPWTWAILGCAFISDATVTLIRRFLRGKRVTTPHREHAYQVLARRIDSHLLVSCGVVALNLAWLLPMAWLSHVWPAHGVWLLVVAATPVVIAVTVLGGSDTNSVKS